LIGSLLGAAPARANFHLWKIKELYSNADGSIQYIELFTSNDGQGVLLNHVIGAGLDDHSFNFPNSLDGSTLSKHLLLATPGFSKLPGAVQPDYVLPCGPFFDPAGDTINFSNVDSVTFGASTLPTDGTNSLTDTDLGPGTTLVSGASSPTNFAGATGSLALTGCLQDGSCDACAVDEDGEFCNGVSECSGTSCTTTAPCAGTMCDEVEDKCFECADEGDCDDDNPCTDDSCNGERACEHADNSAACDDGHFCTTTDACSAGACVGTGDACDGTGCNEGSDTCGDCADDPDCDDGDFCNGEETCDNGTCAAGSEPCVAGDESCDEAQDSCNNVCGNSKWQSGEECDDGNDDDGDGCSASCQVEEGWECETDVGTSVCMEMMSPAPDAGTTPSDDAGTGSDDAGMSMPGDKPDAGDDGPTAGKPSTHDRDGGDSSEEPGGSERDGGDGDGGASSGDDDEDSGCSCRMVRAERTTHGASAWIGLSLLGLALQLRRRARSLKSRA